MPKLDKTPEQLRPYTFHGLDLSPSSGTEHTGECPWCGQAGKFSVNEDTSKWRCWTCDESGNSASFLVKLWKASDEVTNNDHYRGMAEKRDIRQEALIEWGFAKSITTGKWLLPGYNPDGKLTNLYQYVNNGKRWLWLPTPTCAHQLFGNVSECQKRYVDSVYLCEGIWDGMRLWQNLREHKVTETGLVKTANVKASLLSTAVVLAMPGAMTFTERLAGVFKDRNVYLFGQNDLPRKHPKTGKRIEPASYQGMRRVAKMLHGIAKELHWLQWGEAGYNAGLPSGYDVDDAFCKSEWLKGVASADTVEEE